MTFFGEKIKGLGMVCFCWLTIFPEHHHSDPLHSILLRQFVICDFNLQQLVNCKLSLIELTPIRVEGCVWQKLWASLDPILMKSLSLSLSLTHTHTLSQTHAHTLFPISSLSLSETQTFFTLTDARTCTAKIPSCLQLMKSLEKLKMRNRKIWEHALQKK